MHHEHPREVVNSIKKIPTSKIIGIVKLSKKITCANFDFRIIPENFTGIFTNRWITLLIVKYVYKFTYKHLTFTYTRKKISKDYSIFIS